MIRIIKTVNETILICVPAGSYDIKSYFPPVREPAVPLSFLTFILLTVKCLIAFSATALFLLAAAVQVMFECVKEIES